MWVAAQGERSFMPFGMCSRQNDIGRPNTRVSMPAELRWAPSDSPYGPAPTTATSQSSRKEEFTSLTLGEWKRRISGAHARLRRTLTRERTFLGKGARAIIGRADS